MLLDGPTLEQSRTQLAWHYYVLIANYLRTVGLDGLNFRER